MTKALLSTAFCLLAGAVTLWAAATEPSRVSILLSSSIAPFMEAADRLQADLRRTDDPPELHTFRLPSNPQETARVLDAIQATNPSVVVPVGSVATRAVIDAGWPTPIVYSMVLHPNSSGLSGPRVTGAKLDVPFEEQFAMLRRLLPKARRVGVFYNPQHSYALVTAARKAANANGFSLMATSIDGPDDVVRSADSLLEHSDVLWSLADTSVFTESTTRSIILSSLRRRKPFVGVAISQVRAGALAALVCSSDDIGAQTGELVRLVLAGTPPETIAPTHPRACRLHVNARTADRMAVRLDPVVLADASVVTP